MAPRTSRPRQLILLLLALASGAAVAAGFGLAGWFRPQATAGGIPADDPDGDAPRRVGPLAPALFGPDSDEAVCVQRALHSPKPGSRNLPYCCHLVRLYGSGPIPGPHFASGREVLAALTDLASSERYFGEPAFFPTRSGIRYRPLYGATALGAENHRDICLATFAEAGLPLSTEFTTPTATFHLRDLLRDSVQNFHLQQKELPWTAVAYALYPGVGTRWTNRFGETFGWDELTEAMLATPFERSSCGGAHLLYALTLIRRVEATDRLLSAPVRARLDGWLKARVASACARQEADGHWPADWWADEAGTPAAPGRRFADSAFDRLVFTGHLLECLTLAPPELQPPADVYRRAARWLCRALQDDRIDGEGVICPRTHAIGAVRNLTESNRDPAARRPPGPADGAGDGRPPRG
jgi:hypothetical protein